MVIPLGASADGAKAENELFDAAYKYAKGWFKSHQGTAAEFIAALMDQFGFGIRLWVADLVERLRRDADIIRLDREYLDSLLSSKQIGAVLQGREKKHTPPDSTLDELFAHCLQPSHGCELDNVFA